MPPSIDVLTSSSAPAWSTALMALKSPLPSPNVMVPKQSFETRRPVLPSVAYSMMPSILRVLALYGRRPGRSALVSGISRGKSAHGRHYPSCGCMVSNAGCPRVTQLDATRCICDRRADIRVAPNQTKRVASLWPVNNCSCNLIFLIGAAKVGQLAHTLGLRLSIVELRAPARDLLGREMFDVAVIELPVGIGTPCERRLDGRPRGLCRLENA